MLMTLQVCASVLQSFASFCNALFCLTCVGGYTSLFLSSGIQSICIIKQAPAVCGCVSVCVCVCVCVCVRAAVLATRVYIYPTMERFFSTGSVSVQSVFFHGRIYFIHIRIAHTRLYLLTLLLVYSEDACTDFEARYVRRRVHFLCII